MKTVRTTLATALAGAALFAGPASAGRATASKPCHDGAPPGALCGRVLVPLDRAHPKRGSIAVAFELYPRLERGRPRLGTVVAVQGGPGISTTATRDEFLQSLGPLLARRDLVLVDARGTGRSGAIDCPALERALADPLAAHPGAVDACGRQLGRRAYDYGSTAIADDVDAVRAALGRGRVDLYAPSAAAIVGTAYAARHAAQLRSLVLDSPASLADATWFTATARAVQRSVVLICERSPSCGPRNRPAATLAALAGRLRRHPLVGTGVADGRRRHVRLDEAGLAMLLQSDDAGFLNQGEITAAGAALLRRGDAAPLLRLAAENRLPFPPDDPHVFSAGAQAATVCADDRFAWSTRAAPVVRRSQYERARAQLGPRRFGPFSVAAWTRAHPGPGLGSPFCLDWPRGGAPVAGATGRLPRVPTLVLGSDVEIAPADARAVAARFPEGRFVRIANAGHVTASSSGCADAIAVHFVETLATGDTGCAGDVVPRYAVAEFPRLARQAAPAPAAAGNHAGLAERRVAAVAWMAGYDAIQHSFRQSSPAGLGLRGGSFRAVFGSRGETVSCHGVRFAADVAVSGVVGWSFATGRVHGRLAVTVDGRPAGVIRPSGLLFPHTGRVHLRGTVEGRHLEASLATA